MSNITATSCSLYSNFENDVNTMILSELPVELLQIIFSYLSRQDIFWGIGLSCLRLLDVSYESIPHIIEIPDYVSEFKNLVTFLQENVFHWNEATNIITGIIICDSIDNAEKIYQSSNYISKDDGMTLSVTKVSFSSDSQVASVLMPLRNLTCFVVDSLNWTPSDDLFIQLDGKHEKLVYLHLGKASKISDEGILFMTDNKPNLKSITLQESSQLSNLSFHISAHNCNELKELKISWCRNLTDGAIIQLSKSCVGISTLHICGSHRITDRAMKEVLITLKKLEDLNISGCILVTEKSFQYLSENNRGIKKINLGGCRNITDLAITYISSICYELEYLYLGGCIKVTDNGIKTLSNCKNLIGLSLGECSEITDYGLSEISKKCRLLQALILYRCQKVSDDGMNCLAENSSHLVTLDIRYCFRITDHGLSSIAKNCLFLANLYLDSAFYRKSAIDKPGWYALFHSHRVTLSPLRGPFYDDVLII